LPGAHAEFQQRDGEREPRTACCIGARQAGGRPQPAGAAHHQRIGGPPARAQAVECDSDASWKLNTLGMALEVMQDSSRGVDARQSRQA